MYDIDRGVIVVDIPIIAYEAWSVAVLNENGVDRESTIELAEVIDNDYKPEHKHAV